MSLWPIKCFWVNANNNYHTFKELLSQVATQAIILAGNYRLARLQNLCKCRHQFKLAMLLQYVRPSNCCVDHTLETPFTLWLKNYIKFLSANNFESGQVDKSASYIRQRNRMLPRDLHQLSTVWSECLISTKSGMPTNKPKCGWLPGNASPAWKLLLYEPGPGLPPPGRGDVDFLYNDPSWLELSNGLQWRTHAKTVNLLR